MSQGKRCPKCGGEMTEGSTETLGRNFACTRSEPKPGEVNVRVQSFHCGNCGYMEFYRELKQGEGVKP
jgi:predicted nucleic-acid-binding Zn-ribbon protein